MRATTPSVGEAVALCRQLQLPAGCDPLALYAALSERGTRADTMLFERTQGPTLLLDRAAVRAECRGREVNLWALTPGGSSVLAGIAESMVERVASFDQGRLELRFPEHDGADARQRLLAPSPFDALRALTSFRIEAGSEDFAITCLGVIAYDHVDLFERLPAATEDPLGFPDFLFWLAESIVLFEPGTRPRAMTIAFGARDKDEARRNYFGAADRLEDLVRRCERARPSVATAVPSAPNFSQADVSDEAFEAVVTQMKAHIAEGEVYQIVPSRTFRAPCPDPLRAYASLRALDRSPYTFFIAAPEHLLFGASPETSVRVYRDDSRRVEVKPIAGTRPRGTGDDEDDRLEAEMRLDAKELAEHMMLVDLARNDVARISVPGTRRVAQLMSVERYARVMHLVSSVTGVLKGDLDAFGALQACLNVGTLTGAPKIRATELLRETERTKRGPYGGAVGWINGAGDMDTAVVIRSAVVQGGTAFVRAGAGIVHDSDPEAEADETRRKASAILSALAGASVSA